MSATINAEHFSRYFKFIEFLFVSSCYVIYVNVN